jgi:Uma2 family endonuclease
MASNPLPRITEAEYLALDRAAEIRSEFIDGEMVAMSGGTPEHSTVAVNLTVELGNRLGDGPCQVFNNDLRIRVRPGRMYTYPDLSVVCGELQFSDDIRDTITNPSVIFEVLSPSTERYDRGKKFAFYENIQSLKSYVLVSQEEMLVEHFTRTEANTWTMRRHTKPEDELHIAEIGVSIPLAAIYRRVQFEQ